MWIKEQQGNLEKSLNDNLNFLFKSNNVYLMDNHLAAGWSWLNNIDPNGTYNLLHIDRHYDLINKPEIVNHYIVAKGINIHELNLQHYLDLKLSIGKEEFQIFRWDNYIMNINTLYPNLFGLKYFATHKVDDLVEGFIDKELEFHNLINDIESLVKNNIQNKWILNLDIDYFFGDIGNKTEQIFSDNFIRGIGEIIKSISNNCVVITIALSPDCCGGWEQSYEKCKILCEILAINFSLDF